MFKPKDVLMEITHRHTTVSPFPHHPNLMENVFFFKQEKNNVVLGEKKRKKERNDYFVF
jgi:hypothetical protein